MTLINVSISQIKVKDKAIWLYINPISEEIECILLQKSND